jgi:hypothetical protein
LRNDGVGVQVVAIHVAKEEIKAMDVKEGVMVETYGEDMLEFSVPNGKPMVMVEGASKDMAANIIEADLMSCAGPIHRIDKVLLPLDAAVPAAGPEKGMDDASMDPLGATNDGAPMMATPPPGCNSIATKLLTADTNTQLLAKIAKIVRTASGLSLAQEKNELGGM